ncbi:MAG: hypothetical protein P8179_11655 [Candidatus Thiodiazotropha sp.]
MKSALVVVQGKSRSCTSMCPRHLCIHARRATTRNSPLFQGVAQACYSRCSVIHPVGDHNHRSYFLQNQIPVIRMERSTDFFRFNCLSVQQHWGFGPAVPHFQSNVAMGFSLNSLRDLLGVLYYAE